jgi:hypothetical protein
MRRFPDANDLRRSLSLFGLAFSQLGLVDDVSAPDVTIRSANPVHILQREGLPFSTSIFPRSHNRTDMVQCTKNSWRNAFVCVHLHLMNDNIAANELLRQGKLLVVDNSADSHPCRADSAGSTRDSTGAGPARRIAGRPSWRVQVARDRDWSRELFAFVSVRRVRPCRPHL